MTVTGKALVQAFYGQAVATIGDSKFTEADAEVVRMIYEGPRTQDGSFIWYGLTRGSDFSMIASTKGNPPKAAQMKQSIL